MWTFSPARLYAAGALAAFVAISAVPAHANLIQNGDFATGTFDYWTVSGNVGAATGYAVFNAGDLPADAVLTQTIATTIGTNYELTFDYSWGSYNGLSQSMIASILDGATLLATTVASPPSDGGYPATSGGWQPFTLSFTAVSGATTIQMADDPSNYSISADGAFTNVVVEDVPEPASMSLLAFGVGATLLRRSRRKAA